MSQNDVALSLSALSVEDDLHHAPAAKESGNYNDNNQDGDDVKIVSETPPTPRQPTTPAASFDGPWVCPLSQVAFSREDEFRDHLQRKLKVYWEKCVCPECRARCPTATKMTDHFFYVHGGLDKLVCDKENCVEWFWTEEELRDHQARPHPPDGRKAGWR